MLWVFVNFAFIHIGIESLMCVCNTRMVSRKSLNYSFSKFSITFEKRNEIFYTPTRKVYLYEQYDY